MAMVVSTALYASEILKTRRKLQGTLDSLHQLNLRKTTEIAWRERIKNEEINRTEQISAAENSERKRMEIGCSDIEVTIQSACWRSGRVKAKRRIKRNRAARTSKMAWMLEG